MNNRIARLVILALTVAASATVANARGGPDAQEVLAKASKRYASIRDASASFVQQTQFGVMKSEQSYAGRFSMRKGNQYRIEGDEQTIVTDGTSVWTYSKANRQLLIDRYKGDVNVFVPENILRSGQKDYTATLVTEEKPAADNMTLLKLIPKGDEGRFKWVKLWIDRNDWLMKKAQVVDLADNVTTYTITDIHINKSLPDSLFRFEAPPQTDVIDLR